MELSARLKSVYELLPHGCVMIDVGTDHCYLPIYALEQGKITRSFAADVRPGPLENGKTNARLYGFEAQITTLLSDGLQALSPMQQAEIDTVVCAGMGGTLIQNIIAAAPFVKDQRITLILQPQKAIYELKEFLAAEGFEIEAEALSAEGDKLYQCMRVRYSGKPHPAPNPFIHLKEDPLFTVYYKKESARLHRQKRGMEQGGVPDRTRFDTVCKQLEALEEMK
ncbi:MAG: SAM-dependent methyltransferase [Clostridia bacterium]|nr:SAM-dependent methyltransferase [Clostridia bacterium]